MANYKTPDPFMELFFDFTGYMHNDYPKNRRAIAYDLARALSKQMSTEKKGTLVVANSSGIYVYSAGSGHKLLAFANYRAVPDSGFYELTSLSHVGPAIAYLGVLQKYGDECWREHLAPMRQHLYEIRELNSVDMKDHWLTQLDCVSWRGREPQIKKMVDYACALAGNYLQQVEDNPDDFSSAHLVQHFLEIRTKAFPIPFNTVMIGTFSLVGLKGACDVYRELSSVDMDWSNAEVLLHNLVGTNYSAGLTPRSNWVFPLLRAVSHDKLPKSRIFITPYGPDVSFLGQPALTDEQYDSLSIGVWGALSSRPQMSKEAFCNIEDILISDREPLPGDHVITEAHQIDHFLKRLKLSTSSSKEMLSNTVGFWLSGEALAKNWDVTRMNIPGFTHGLPDGRTEYPSYSPAFEPIR
jgi:hypothetical protein